MDYTSGAILLSLPSMATILIVDDHRGTRLGLAEMLGDAGYTVVTTGTFQEARDLLRHDPPDLLIADVRLGSFNGLQLVISGQHRIPAIVITGYADPVLEAEARRGGAEYLVKPFDPERLLTMIREKLGAAPPSFAVPRRWRRKVVAGLTAHVDDQPARIVDVSYGGVRFEIRPPEQSTLPPTFQLRLANLALQANLVWKSMLNDDVWVCGAAVWPEEASARQWFGLVDTMH
jgi:DNA-binding response OmpR family regulator